MEEDGNRNLSGGPCRIVLEHETRQYMQTQRVLRRPEK